MRKEATQHESTPLRALGLSTTPYHISDFGGDRHYSFPHVLQRVSTPVRHADVVSKLHDSNCPHDDIVPHGIKRSKARLVSDSSDNELNIPATPPVCDSTSYHVRYSKSFSRSRLGMSLLKTRRCYV